MNIWFNNNIINIIYIQWSTSRITSKIMSNTNTNTNSNSNSMVLHLAMVLIMVYFNFMSLLLLFYNLIML